MKLLIIMTQLAAAKVHLLWLLPVEFKKCVSCRSFSENFPFQISMPRVAPGNTAHKSHKWLTVTLCAWLLHLLPFLFLGFQSSSLYAPKIIFPVVIYNSNHFCELFPIQPVLQKAHPALLTFWNTKNIPNRLMPIAVHGMQEMLPFLRILNWLFLLKMWWGTLFCPKSYGILTGVL